MRASDTAEILFEDCRIPGENLLGAEGEGFINSLRVLDGGRIGLGALAVGIAQGAFEVSLNYAKERKRFGRPIMQYEGVSFKIAEHYVNLEAARCLLYQAMHLIDQGLPFTKESAMAKLFGVNASISAVQDCMFICGYTAYSMEHWIQDRMRGVLAMGIADGAEQIQKLLILTTTLAGRPSQPCVEPTA